MTSEERDGLISELRAHLAYLDARRTHEAVDAVFHEPAVRALLAALDEATKRSKAAEVRGARLALDACYDAIMRDWAPPISPAADQRARDAVRICTEATLGDKRLPVCTGCGHEIDLSCCWCGNEREAHGHHLSGHDFRPMGCVCGFADEAEKGAR